MVSLLYFQRKWVANNLGPTLRNSSHSDLKLLIHDDQRATIIFVQEVIQSPSLTL